MPRIKNLPPNTEGLKSNDVFPSDNISTDDAEKVTVQQIVDHISWIDAEETWTYVSWSSTTRIGVIDITEAGASSKYTAGNRIRISQTTGGIKYGIIVEVTDDDTITVFFPDGTTLNNQTISSPYWSYVKVPFGFPMDGAAWTLVYLAPGGEDETTGLTSYQQLGTGELTVPIGAWILKSSAYIEWRFSSTVMDLGLALSTSSTGVSDTEMFARYYNNNNNSGSEIFHNFTRLGKSIKLAGETTLYIIGKIAAGGTEIDLRADSWIRATCDYL